ncbi:hypothetical protein N5853_00865 [Bartonella sp. HY329]|nr:MULTISPECIES: hypothetical protein [unclassified Bartonella]UXM95241.1 hypothetical protein N5853_00865 [Bartonella sp. HY329]UXN09565.1 hypothetical protein N5852_00870 [Bartonella sp. HY328]UXN10524.1 hypothetical protein N5852_06220 [Bartonella sp. HY328]
MGFKNKRFTLLTSLIDKIRAMNEGTSIGMALRGISIPMLLNH